MAELPRTPCAFEPELLDDALYDPSVFLLDQLLELDPERSLVRCRIATDPPDAFTAAQRVDPVRHPAHVAGAALIQATGSIGFVHAYYLLGLRSRDGWSGYGTHIHKAVFRKLVSPGVPIEATCTATRIRPGPQRYLVRYRFEFRAEGERCYDGDQTAFWFRASDESPSPLGAVHPVQTTQERG